MLLKSKKVCKLTTNLGISIIPNIPPRVATDIALPLSREKYLAIDVEPACVIAPCPKNLSKNNFIFLIINQAAFKQAAFFMTNQLT